MTFWDYLKNVFLILIFLQIAPGMFESIRKQYGIYLEPHTRIGVIPMKGMLHDSSYYNRYLMKYFKDSSIKAIIIKMECPGGASGTGQAIYSEIMKLKKEYKKPIITLVENVCASGAYHIASATDYIITPPSAIIGSIGAYFPYLFKLKEFIEQFKIRHEPLLAGSYKAATDPLYDTTPEQKAMLQSMLDDTYDQLVQDIARNRKLSLKTKGQWADGKIFTGRQALKLGLVDKLGSASDVIYMIKEKALIEGEIDWVYPPQVRTIWSMFGGGHQDPDNSLFTSIAEKTWAFVESKLFGMNVY